MRGHSAIIIAAAAIAIIAAGTAAYFADTCRIDHI
jgi:hypothetical protein